MDVLARFCSLAGGGFSGSGIRISASRGATLAMLSIVSTTLTIQGSKRCDLPGDASCILVNRWSSNLELCGLGQEVFGWLNPPLFCLHIFSMGTRWTICGEK